ncbi:MAG: hypothetical protein JWO37_3026 [Acidimicrobiales bacterium]|nr:hypothetical protein [Acidimicrobiales bacterium]
MNGNVSRVAWYRFRATFGVRRGGYVALVLLIGLVGGLAMGAVAAARRTGSSFAAFRASTNPSDLTVALLDPRGYDQSLVSAISHVAHVKRVERYTFTNVSTLAPDGSPTAPPQISPLGSIDGLGFDVDRPAVVQGRMANPKRSDEFVASADAARLLGLHLGEVVAFGAYTNDQTGLAGFGTAAVAPFLRLDLRLVGIVVGNDQVVPNDSDRHSLVLFTPALAQRLAQCPHSLLTLATLNASCFAGYSVAGLQLDHGARDVAAVEADINRVLPSDFRTDFATPAATNTQAARAIKPQAIALGVFGAIAALVTLLTAGQVIGRQLRLGGDELDTLRALGAGPAITTTDGLVGVLGAVVLGSLLAAVVAVGLSPLAPIGPVRPVYPSPGIAFDSTVLGIGILILVAALSTLALGIASRTAPHRRAARRRLRVPRGSSVARAAIASGAPAPAVEGIRFALEPGAGRDAVPVRSAIGGAALAMAVVVATLTFGASLHSLVSRPPLYGWNWDYVISAGLADIDPGTSAPLLDHNRDVAAWAGFNFATLRVDGKAVPVLGGTPNASVGPPVLSGHGFDAPDQVVIGPTTLARLHKRVGDTVEVDNGVDPPKQLRIVGTATMPTIGGFSVDNLSMGTGALLSYDIIPAGVRNTETDPVPGPNAIFVRLRHGANPAAARRSLQHIADTLPFPPTTGAAATLLPVQRPAEITNYRSMSTTPALLGAALAVGAMSALGLTLIASVRRRRRDLALLKTLGFTRRQLMAVVSWQSTFAVVIGSVVGVPLGIAVGRQLWILFARSIDSVPQPTVPLMSVVLIAVGAVVLANLVAAVPGRSAARTPAATVLRTG